MNFFKTVFQVCTGTTVFLHLMNRSLLRALFHFVLLTFLVALLFSSIQSFLLGREVRRVSSLLFEQLGGVSVTKAKGIRTLNTPEEKKGYILNPQMRFDYLPGTTFQPGMVKNWDSPAGIIVTDRAVVAWIAPRGEMGGGRYMLMATPIDGALSQTPFLLLFQSAEELEKHIIDNFRLKEGQQVDLRFWNDGVTFRSPNLFANQIIAALWIFTMILSFTGMLILALIGILFFAMAQYFWSNGSEERKLTFRTILVVMLYAAFPPLIIAALYSSLGLPLLGFQTVFFVTFFIYHLVVFNRIQKQLNPPKEEDDDIF